MYIEVLPKSSQERTITVMSMHRTTEQTWKRAWPLLTLRWALSARGLHVSTGGHEELGPQARMLLSLGECPVGAGTHSLRWCQEVHGVFSTQSNHVSPHFTSHSTLPALCLRRDSEKGGRVQEWEPCLFLLSQGLDPPLSKLLPSFISVPNFPKNRALSWLSIERTGSGAPHLKPGAPGGHCAVTTGGWMLWFAL